MIEEVQAGVDFVVSYPNITIGILIGFVICYVLMERGFISVPSVNKQLRELSEENAGLKVEVAFMQKSAEGAADFNEFKSSLVTRELERISGKSSNG